MGWVKRGGGGGEEACFCHGLGEAFWGGGLGGKEEARKYHPVVVMSMMSELLMKTHV